jgi:hypothetical protein
LKIGILSDTHNHRHNTETALAALREREIKTVLHCGDLTAPDMIYLFAEFDTTFVFGNMDDSRPDLIEAAQQIGANAPKLSQEIEIAGKTIAICHGNDHGLLFRLMVSGKYAYVCHGHTHERRDEFRRAYSVRLINPGALGGRAPQTRSICVLDLATDQAEFVEFPKLF